MEHDQPVPRKSGLPFALGAHLIWGLLPLYLVLFKTVPPFEFVGWRILFTLPVCALFVAVAGQSKELWAALTNRRVLLLLTLSALLIATNWLTYIVAIQQGHVFAASLGYYINPLANVLAGTLFLGERLSHRQWGGVALAAAGVSLLAWDALDMLGISLALAVSFCGYGLVRKLTPVGSLPGLTVETIVLLPLAVGLIGWAATTPQGISFGHEWSLSALLACAGLVTAVPLILFAVAAQRMDYSVLGMVQYIGPTMVFVQAFFLSSEPLGTTQVVCFILIWCAIALFVWDLLAKRKAARAA
jgi:chloramphenicol-sensitive protein RarD